MSVLPSEDAKWMRRAVALARRATRIASPNPMVGAVVVSDGNSVGEGWHRGIGTPHAEAVALEAAGHAASGATIYVTLEPCAHHGHTPPCVDRLLDAGIVRVVVGTIDPDPRVRGRGIHGLEAQGVEVVSGGPWAANIARLYEPYVTHRTKGRPFVTYKAAISLDGRTAAADGSSRWITGEQAREQVHRMRALSDAICVGVGTVLSDDPRLTARDVRVVKQPLRVVLDTNARTPVGAKVLSDDSPTLIVAGPSAPDDRIEVLRRSGAEVVQVPEAEGGVDLAVAMKELAGAGVMSLLLEGGATLAAGFASSGIVDRYTFFVAPKLLGETPHGLLGGWTAKTMGEARALRLDKPRVVGRDLWIDAFPEEEGI